MDTNAAALAGILQPKGFPPLPKGWTSEWESYVSRDRELKLFSTSHFAPESALRGRPQAILVVHGFGEHAGRYLHFPAMLDGAIAAIHMPDLRGHGRSEGLRGHVQKFDSLIEDTALAVEKFHAKLSKKFEDFDLHLFAHSLGGHVGLRLLHQYPDLPLESATISAPFLAVKQPVPWIKLAASRVLRSVWSNLQIPIGLNAQNLSRDPEVVSLYLRDRLNHDKMTPAFHGSMMAAIANTLTFTSGIKPRIQFIVPLADEIVDPAVTRSFFEKLEHPHKVWNGLEGFPHESFNDQFKEHAFQMLKAWIVSHVH